MQVAAIVCPLWFMANCLYNYSLLMTSVSSSTIISNLAGTFTLTFSWMAGVESITKVSYMLMIIISLLYALMLIISLLYTYYILIIIFCLLHPYTTFLCLSYPFMLIISLFLFDKGKVLGILACFVGAVCVGLKDSSDDSTHTLVGDLVALLGALGYGLYTIAIRYQVSRG
jgi:drug/metabolite transporter (DMT)-like permease